MNDPRYDTFLGRGPRQLLHWEHWSCPDAETFLTGIDYYEHPRLCRLKLKELYPELRLGIPAQDAAKPRPRLGLTGDSSNPERHTVRWGDGESGTWEHGESIFKTPEDVFAFSPLAHADFTKWGFVVEARDYSSEDALYKQYHAGYPAESGSRGAPGAASSVSFYNTMFMWPLLTFGWEMFMTCCLDPEFDRVMEEFAEINRRVFRTFARLPVNFVVCHDDIVMTRGPVCSRAWMNRHIFPRYEEFWGLLRKAGKEVIFMADGCMDAFADDVMRCGARGIISEPYTDYKAIARRHDNPFLAGEGDNRVLFRNNPAEIRAMVERMAETGRLSGGYMMCIGNHIPWNTPPAAIKLYLELSRELAKR